MKDISIVLIGILLTQPAMASMEPINSPPQPSMKQVREVRLTQVSVFGESDLGIIGGAACVEDSTPTKEYFEYWFSSGHYIPGIGSLKNIGTNGKSSIGEWDKGNANLDLGSTSAGAAVVCFPEYSSARVTVQEYIGNGIWHDLWSQKGLYGGVGYGYWFKGLAVRRIRVLVRDNEGTVGQLFYWGGSY
ncbi:hypothetical protein AB0758_47020 [Tolypothrix bouteillei VB521301_2]